MKPAPSIIGFTTASGLGYGMLFVLAIGALSGLIPTERWLGLVVLIIALGAITAGLLASTLHLGHPERAWRAISQWRSSWLSREGLLALLTYVPAMVFAFGWIVQETVSGFYGLMALAAAIGAAATVFCTGKIYASLPPIRDWHQPLTAPIYMAFALMSGALAVHVLLLTFGVPALIIGILAMAATAVAFGLKIAYWRKASENRTNRSTAESATGLGAFGLVRMLDPPHTQSNYLLDEMGFQIGRKHARALRMLTFVFGLFMPLIATLIALTLEAWTAVGLALSALVSGLIGILIERWLFFAEAEHTMMLYYNGNQHASDPMTAAASQWQADAEASLSQPQQRRRPVPERTRKPLQAYENSDATTQPKMP